MFEERPEARRPFGLTGYRVIPYHRTSVRRTGAAGGGASIAPISRQRWPTSHALFITVRANCQGCHWPARRAAPMVGSRTCGTRTLLAAQRLTSRTGWCSRRTGNRARRVRSRRTAARKGALAHEHEPPIRAARISGLRRRWPPARLRERAPLFLLAAYVLSPEQPRTSGTAMANVHPARRRHVPAAALRNDHRPDLRRRSLQRWPLALLTMALILCAHAAGYLVFQKCRRHARERRAAAGPCATSRPNYAGGHSAAPRDTKRPMTPSVGPSPIWAIRPGWPRLRCWTYPW